MDDAFQWIINNGGICTEDGYAYSGSDGSCNKARSPVANCVDVKQSSLHGLKAAGTQQPIYVAIEADQFSFQFYSRGVLNRSCGTQLNHGVLTVGYGAEDGKDY
jgi:hypothetical protein